MTPELTKQLEDIGNALNEILKPRGFVLLIFDRYPDGQNDLLSNGNKEEVLAVMKQFIFIHETQAKGVH